MSWTLILFASIGMLGHYESNALTSVPGFTEAACAVAARKATEQFKTTTAGVKAICVSATEQGDKK